MQWLSAQPAQESQERMILSMSQKLRFQGTTAIETKNAQESPDCSGISAGKRKWICGTGAVEVGKKSEEPRAEAMKGIDFLCTHSTTFGGQQELAEQRKGNSSLKM